MSDAADETGGWDGPERSPGFPDDASRGPWVVEDVHYPEHNMAEEQLDAMFRESFPDATWPRRRRARTDTRRSSYGACGGSRTG